MSSEKFKYQRVSGTPVTNDELIKDLKLVSSIIESKKVTQNLYRQYGMYDETTIIRRFGSWNKAIILAELEISNENNISDEKLFENILLLWQLLGRQPRRNDLTRPESTCSQSPYNRRFKSWTKALLAFVEYMNDNDSNDFKSDKKNNSQNISNSRDPSLRLRYKILKRDSFKCIKCGRSPANDQSIILHIDHIIPWNKGGETIENNLQTLCSKCNLGKSDIH